MSEPLAVETREATISPWQCRVLAVPEEYDLALLGGRGPGKSYSLAFLILRHLEQYKDAARVLYLRRTLKSLRDFEDTLYKILKEAYGDAAKYNKQAHLWRLPYGYVELSQLMDEADLDALQGRSFTLLICDEITQYPDFVLLDKLRPNLRSPEDVPLRMVVAGNPGGIGHAEAAKRWVLGKPKWEPFVETVTGKTYVHCFGTYRDNPYIRDHEAYRAELRALAGGDPELARAWENGDWDIDRGAYFSKVLSQERSLIRPWPVPERKPWSGVSEGQARRAKRDPYYSAPQWRYQLAYDHGSRRPACCLVLAYPPNGGGSGPDGRYYPNDSVVVIGEFASDSPEDLNVGTDMTVSELADKIIDLSARWKIAPRGVADDSMFAKHGHDEGSLADQFRKHGVYFSPAHKGGRVAGWNRLSDLMQGAGDMSRPGLYISSECRFLWQTLPIVNRDPRNPEDVDTRGYDDGADALRYGAITGPQGIKVTRHRIGV